MKKNKIPSLPKETVSIPPLPKLTEARQVALKQYKNQRDRITKIARKTGTLTPTLPTVTGLAEISTQNVKKLTKQLQSFTAKKVRQTGLPSVSISGSKVILEEGKQERGKKQKEPRPKRRPKKEVPKIDINNIIAEEQERIKEDWRKQGLSEEEINERIRKYVIEYYRKKALKKKDKEIRERQEKEFWEQQSRRKEQEEIDKSTWSDNGEPVDDFMEDVPHAGEIVYQNVQYMIETATFKGRASRLNKMLDDNIRQYGFDVTMKSIASAPSEILINANKICYESQTEEEFKVQMVTIAMIITGEILSDEESKAISEEQEEQDTDTFIDSGDFEKDNPFTNQ